MQKISVLINTLNEEKHIADCLESVKWADEIILVDMYSDDNTVAIASKLAKVRVFYHERCGFADPARAFALQQVRNDWVLMLDADERINLATAKKINQLVNDNKVDVIYLSRHNYYIGELISCGGYTGELLPRVFKKEFMNYTGVVHAFETVRHDARVIKVRSSEVGILHFAYNSIDLVLDKQNKYSRIEAVNIFDGVKPPLKLWRILFNYPYRLLGNLIYRKGYKQFKQQIILMTFHLFYELSIYIKFYYVKKFNNKDYMKVVDEKYKQVSKNIISEYNDA